MKRLIYGSKKLYNEYLKQDFYPHTLPNGKIIWVSEDSQYYYEKEL